MNLGPTVLFDLAAIYNFFEKKWPINKELNKKLGIEKNFELCKELIERASDESRFSSKSKLLANQIFGYSHWLRVADELRIRDSLLKTSRAENFEKLNFFSKALFKFRYTRTLYQVSYFSVKFWLFLGSDIFTDLRKVMRGYFN